jgi:hypothetical protein
MKSSYIVVIIVAISVIAFIFYTTQGGQSPEDYANGIKKEREEKNVNVLADPELPFAKATEKFKGLKYFEPDLKFKIIANLLPIENKKILTLPTSDGKEKNIRSTLTRNLSWME